MDAKIDKIDKEIETRLENIKTQLDSRPIELKENIDEAKDEKQNDVRCKYFNKGFCKMKKTCLFKHKSTKRCESRKCSNKKCEKRLKLVATSQEELAGEKMFAPICILNKK